MPYTTNPRIAAQRRKNRDQREQRVMAFQSKEAEKAGERAERRLLISKGKPVPPLIGRESVKRPSATAQHKAAGHVRVYGKWKPKGFDVAALNRKQAADRRDRRIQRGLPQRLSFQLEGEREVTLKGAEAKRATRSPEVQQELDAMAARAVTRPLAPPREAPRIERLRRLTARYEEDLARPPADELAVSDLMLAGKSRQEALGLLRGTGGGQGGGSEPYKGANLLRSAMPPRMEDQRPAQTPQAPQAAPQAAPVAPAAQAPIPAAMPAQPPQAPPQPVEPSIQQIQQEMAGGRIPAQVPIGGESPAQSQAWAQQWMQGRGVQQPQPAPMPMAPMPPQPQFDTWMSDTGPVPQPAMPQAQPIPPAPPLARESVVRPTAAQGPVTYGTPETITPEQQAAAAARMAQRSQELSQLYAQPDAPLPQPARMDYMRQTPEEAVKTGLLEAQRGSLQTTTAAAQLAIGKVKRERLAAALEQIDGIGDDPGLETPLRPGTLRPFSFAQSPQGFAGDTQNVLDDVSRMLTEAADDPVLQRQVAERIAEKPWYKKIAAGYPESIEQNYGTGSRILSGMTKPQQDHWVGLLKAIRTRVQTILQ